MSFSSFSFSSFLLLLLSLQHTRTHGSSLPPLPLHSVYSSLDPRTEIIKEMSRRLSQRQSFGHAGARPLPDLFAVSERIEEVMRREKNLFPNLDFYCASAYAQCGESSL